MNNECKACKQLHRIEVIEAIIKTHMCDEDKIPRLLELRKELNMLIREWEPCEHQFVDVTTKGT